ncbi:terpene synthase family protein [Plantactinospora endophytica]|uniref:Terpene synthase n=1 Tax=Plantactinospora endophytica TaxID=673535 RepID=A0ABQ4E0X9_9ACTN|nr:terpene synthase family protein [Plantactinospora endophytica]GIG88358.1 hypothetical protein Pen02_32940 [Plantactinospora endophytica]
MNPVPTRPAAPDPVSAPVPAPPQPQPLPIDAAVDTCVTALRLIDRLADWTAANGPPFPAAHVNVFCLSTAFVTPWLDVDTLHLATRIWSWITALDDTVDNHPGDLAELDPILANCRAAAGGARVDAADPIAAALAGIRADLADRSGFATVEPLWRDTVHRLVDGMRYEAVTGRALATGAAPAEPGEYLRHAVHTVGVPMYVTALWAAMPPFDAPALLPALRDAALAVRLANDLRGHARESAEGNLDALRLGLTTEQVRAMVGDLLARCHDRLAPLLAAAFPPAVAVHRMAVWGTRIYQHIDFRSPGGRGPGKDDWQFLDWITGAT